MSEAVLIWGLHTEISEGTHVSDDFEEGQCLLVSGASHCLDCCTHCASAADSGTAVDQDYLLVIDCFDRSLHQLAKHFTVLFSSWNAAIRPNSVLDKIPLT